jgi:hypothetical protein
LLGARKVARETTTIIYTITLSPKKTNTISIKDGKEKQKEKEKGRTFEGKNVVDIT